MGPGVPHHDWATLLTEWHLLNHDDAIAFCIRACAVMVWLPSMALGAWLLAIMWQTRNTSKL